MKFKLFFIFLVITFFLLTGYTLYELFTIGSDEEDYDIVCIHGHEYYRANLLSKGFIVIHLTDEGKPIKCQ